MKRLFRTVPGMAALVGLALLGTPGKASAQIEIDFSVDGGARTFGASSGGSLATFSGTVGGLYNVVITVGNTNSPGTPGLAFDTQSNNTVTSLFTSGTHTLTVFVSSTGFTTPQSPPPTTLSSSFSAVALTGGTINYNFQSFADPTNRLFGGIPATPGLPVFPVPAPDTATPNLTSSTTGQAGTGVLANSALFSPNGATYSLTNALSITTNAAFSLTNFSGNTRVTPNPVPVPAGLALALSGLPALGLGWLRRRRKQAEISLVR
jgi:hypothetical protein